MISNVIQTLVRSFELKQERMNIQLTKCIGALGAVDPARLGIERQRQESSSLPICRDLTANSTCAISILTELTRYLATNTVQSEAQDFVCHAIQQVMTAYKIPNPQSGMRIRVEEQIDRHVWDVIQPYLDSRYLISGDTSFVSDEELEHLDLRTLFPIYSTETTKTHHHWLSRFCKRLTSFIIHPSVLVRQNNKYVITSMPKAISFWLISAHQLFSKKDDPQFDQFFNTLNENVGDHYQDLQPYPGPLRESERPRPLLEFRLQFQ